MLSPARNTTTGAQKWVIQRVTKAPEEITVRSVARCQNVSPSMKSRV